jgi:hypothetical protein
LVAPAHALTGDWSRISATPAAELANASEATLVSPLTHLGLIEVAGPDAAAFLHNQLTSDVKHLASEMAQHSAWCSAKGRMLASFLLFHHGAGLPPATLGRPASADSQAPADVRPAEQGEDHPTCRVLTNSSAWPARKPKWHCGPPACRFHRRR